MPKPAAFSEEIEVREDGEATVLRHAADEGVLPMIVLGFATALFVLFVIVVLPLMRVTTTGTVLWMLIGFSLLAFVGVLMQVRTRITTLRIDDAGLTIDQGTPIDREHAAIVWGEIARIELEPVDTRDGTKGMLLRIMPSTGEPIDTLVDVGIADLTEARRIITERWNAKRAQKASTKRPKLTGDGV